MKTHSLTLNHKTYLQLALPLTLSTMTTPILGAVDTAVVGQLSNPAYLGGIAVGTLIFNSLYWLFGFLRVSTSGFAAQALGQGDRDMQSEELMRPLLLALLIGILFIALQWPILQVSLNLINPENDVKAFISQYFYIRIWGAPITLINYVILGWLMGMAQIRFSMFLQITMNLINILLCILFVYGFQLGVGSVATATLIAEGAALLLGIGCIIRLAPLNLNWSRFRRTVSFSKMKKSMMVNSDLLIRTACLLAVFNMFTAAGASFGTDLLAANAILIQIHFIMAYFFDGLANASSILAGRAVGAKDREIFRKTLSLSWQWSLFASVFVAVLFYLLKEGAISLFTGLDTVAEQANRYSVWLIGFPFISSLGLVFYGVFTGSSVTRPIRNSMIGAFFAFLAARFLLVDTYQNDGLWIAFLVFSLARSLLLVAFVPKLENVLFYNQGSLKQEVTIPTK